MATIDWDEIEKDHQNTGGSSKPYAPVGVYKVKVDKAEVRDTAAKSPAVNFVFSDSEDYRFPRSAAHWLSLGNPRFRQYHFCQLLIVLGASKAQAQKLVEQAEQSAERADLVKAYQQVLDQVTSRHAIVEVEVQESIDKDGNVRRSEKGTPYHETEFTDRTVRMNHTTTASANGNDANNTKTEFPF